MKNRQTMVHKAGCWALSMVLILTVISQKTIYACPHPCACYVPTEVHCTFRSLLSVPTRIPKHVERVNLGFNSIQSVAQNAFLGLKRLELLMMHGNDISSLPDEVFRDLVSLQVLKMSYNKLEVLTGHTLLGLSSLLRLHMDNNKIEFIDPNAFSGLISLRLLHLEGNLLKQLHPNTFATFTFLDYFRFSSIRHLFLSNNSIESLPSSIFSPMTLLEAVYLHGNRWSCDCRLNWLLQWNKQHEDVLKCKKDKSYEDGHLCPMCSFPNQLHRKQIFKQDELLCTKPMIELLRKQNHTTDQEDSENELIDEGIIPDDLGNMSLNLTDEHGNKVDLECRIKRPGESSTVSWNQLHAGYMAVNATLSVDILCPIDRTKYEKLWNLIAYYSEVPVTLQRGVMMSEQSQLWNRYRQEQDSDGMYYTGVKSFITATPSWLMQSVIKLRLNRQETSARSAVLSFSSHFLETVQTVNAERTSWVMIEHNQNSETAHSTVLGSECQLICNVHSSGSHTITWILPNGTKLMAPYESSDKRISALSNGKLVIKKIEFSDSGIYHCMAQVKGDYDTVSFRVDVQDTGIPSSITEEVTVHKSAGDSVLLSCRATGTPDARINWILPNSKVINIFGNISRAYVLYNGSLLIEDSQTADNGYYRCIAVNQYGIDYLTVKVTIDKKSEQQPQQNKKRNRKPKLFSTTFRKDIEMKDGSGGGGGGGGGGGEPQGAKGKLSYRKSHDDSDDIKEFALNQDKNHLDEPFNRRLASRRGMQKVKGSKTAVGQRVFQSRRRDHATNKQIDPKQWASILAKVRGKSNGIQPTSALSPTEAPVTTPLFSDLEIFPSAVVNPAVIVNFNSTDTGDESSTDDTYINEDELLPKTVPITTEESIPSHEYNYLTTHIPKDIALKENSKLEDKILEVRDSDRNESPILYNKNPNFTFSTTSTYHQSKFSSPPVIAQPQTTELDKMEFTADSAVSTEGTYSGEKVSTLSFVVDDAVFQDVTENVLNADNYDIASTTALTDSEDIVTNPTGHILSVLPSYVSDPEMTDQKTTEYKYLNHLPSTYTTPAAYRNLLSTTVPHSSDFSNKTSPSGTDNQLSKASNMHDLHLDVAATYDTGLYAYSLTKSTEIFKIDKENAYEGADEVIRKSSSSEKETSTAHNKLRTRVRIRKIKHPKQKTTTITESHNIPTLLATNEPLGSITTSVTAALAEQYRITTASSPPNGGNHRRRRPFGRRRFRPNKSRVRIHHSSQKNHFMTTNPPLMPIPSVSKIHFQDHSKEISIDTSQTTEQMVNSKSLQQLAKTENQDASYILMPFTPELPPSSTSVLGTEVDTTPAQTYHNPLPVSFAVTFANTFLSSSGDTDDATYKLDVDRYPILEERTTSLLSAPFYATDSVVQSNYFTATNAKEQKEPGVLGNAISNSGSLAVPEISTESVITEHQSSPEFSNLKSTVLVDMHASGSEVFAGLSSSVNQITSNPLEQEPSMPFSTDTDHTAITDLTTERGNTITTSSIMEGNTMPDTPGKTEEMDITESSDLSLFTSSLLTTATYLKYPMSSSVPHKSEDAWFPFYVQHIPIKQEKGNDIPSHKTAELAKATTATATTVPHKVYTTTKMPQGTTLLTKMTSRSEVKVIDSNELLISKTNKDPKIQDKYNSGQQELETQLKPDENKHTNKKTNETSTATSSIHLASVEKSVSGQRQETVNVLSSGSAPGFPRYTPVRGTVRPTFPTRLWPHYRIPGRQVTFTNKPEITAHAATGKIQLTTKPPFHHRTNAVFPNIFGNWIPNRWHENSRSSASNLIPDSRGNADRIPSISQGNPYYNPYVRYPARFSRPFIITKLNTTSKPFLFPAPMATERDITAVTRMPTLLSTYHNIITTSAPRKDPLKPNLSPTKVVVLQTTEPHLTTRTQLHRHMPYDQNFHVIPLAPKHEKPFHIPSPAAYPSTNVRTPGQKPTITTTTANTVSVEAEVDVTLPCNAFGNPTPSISWTKVSTGAVMTENTRIQRFEVLKNGTFIIRKVQLQDRGQYQCTARNQYGIDRMLITLSVLAQQAKILSSNFKDITVYLGEQAIIDCKAGGMPSPRITWILPNRKLVHDSMTTAEERISQLDNGTLLIKEATFTDRGVYKCIASNAAGADTLSARLHVAALPPIIQQDRKEEIYFTPGQNVYIHCSAKAAPPPAIRWMLFDGTQIRPSQFVNGNLFVFPNGTLLIRNVSPKDSGSYECVAMNVVGMSKRIVSLSVRRLSSNAKITGTSALTTDITYGSTLQLNCTAAGDPGPRIFWRLPSRKLVDSFYSFESRTKVYPNGTLVVVDITEKDTGDYLCVARNKMGDDFVVLKVNVMMKPATIEQKDQASHKVMHGGDLKVDCIATGLPNPEISWALPDGTMINSVMQSDDSGIRTRRYVVFDNGTLFFNDVGKKEEGDYTCYAENKIGKDEMKVHVKVITEPPIIKNKSYSVLPLLHGDLAVLKCEAKGEPIPRIIWLSPTNKVISSSSEKYRLNSDGTLLISKVQQSDDGNYTCIAQNINGEDKKVIGTQINVQSPKINGYPNAITAVRYTAIEETRKLINCKAEGNPLPRVMWMFPQNIILPAPYYGTRVSVHQNGTLDIKSLKKTDSVQLVCVARNEGGEARLIVQLNVQEKMEMPTFKNPVSERFSLGNAKMIALNCSAEGRPPPEITWILPNGTKLLRGRRVSKFNHAADGTLFISSPSTEDVGIYRCMAKNAIGYVEKAVSVETGQKPVIKSHYSSLVSIINGENLQLHCVTQGEPQPQISWTLPNGVTLSKAQTVGRYSLSQNGSLSVQQASVHDRGTYTCKAVNEYGFSTVSIPVIVIAYPPRITHGPASVTYTRPGNTVQMNCMAIGIPKADIMWELPNQTRLTATSQTRIYGNKLLNPQGSLIIQFPSQQDAGFYKCTAKNVLGSDSKATYLHVF
ncbi:matrix-remodeling-associated protein 5 [Protopterus annectens]|uniref:matrix-remodeling-associated protein 5 n=1 Tax=Protopterus annectens TaxID=7888 RepID=UPI001CFA5005|nr:matrix-remodeling-associated protein 5 [Protopterus annectens]